MEEEYHEGGGYHSRFRQFQNRKLSLRIFLGWPYIIQTILRLLNVILKYNDTKLLGQILNVFIQSHFYLQAISKDT